MATTNVTEQKFHAEFLQGRIAELGQQLEEVYALATAGEVLLSDDKGPAFQLFMTIQRLTGDRKLINGMDEVIQRMASA